MKFGWLPGIHTNSSSIGNGIATCWPFASNVFLVAIMPCLNFLIAL